MSVNVPSTTWRDTSGLTEYITGSPEYIVDPSGTFLVDPSATYITDTGITANLIPATVWLEDDSI